MRGEIVKCDQCGTMEMYSGAHELYKLQTPYTETQIVSSVRRDSFIFEFCSADCLNIWSFTHKENLVKNK